MTDKEIKDRLEYLRGELRGECISYGELAELQSLAPHIDDDDVELLEAAGVPEFPQYVIQGHASDDVGPEYDWDSIYAGDETPFFDTPEEAEAAIVELRKSGPEFADADFRVAEFSREHRAHP